MALRRGPRPWPWALGLALGHDAALNVTDVTCVWSVRNSFSHGRLDLPTLLTRSVCTRLVLFGEYVSVSGAYSTGRGGSDSAIGFVVALPGAKRVTGAWQMTQLPEAVAMSHGHDPR